MRSLEVNLVIHYLFLRDHCLCPAAMVANNGDDSYVCYACASACEQSAVNKLNPGLAWVTSLNGVYM